jgi:hypothetical protein
MRPENMDKILLEPNLSSDDVMNSLLFSFIHSPLIQMDTIKKKKFKSNLIQLTPDDLHKTALKIQEKSFHGQTNEYLMLNVLRGNEFDEWSRYLKFVYI